MATGPQRPPAGRQFTGSRKRSKSFDEKRIRASVGKRNAKEAKMRPAQQAAAAAAAAAAAPLAEPLLPPEVLVPLATRCAPRVRAGLLLALVAMLSCTCCVMFLVITGQLA
ncbi:hypothetical protein JKP88DRAFT_254692 [Tribonema minus]|uniref:Uncharacterized protein n=1 Tax=Tribonema minus TaxID=303371 RepID=A0A836CHM3_9STRA|nr:hypothetical protein JKP88DRAFT_254692 [Tribonema minus]